MPRRRLDGYEMDIFDVRARRVDYRALVDAMYAEIRSLCEDIYFKHTRREPPGMRLRIDWEVQQRREILGWGRPNDRIDYHDMRVDYITSCADYVLALRGENWRYQIMECVGRAPDLVFTERLPPKNAMPVMIGPYDGAGDHYKIVWEGRGRQPTATILPKHLMGLDIQHAYRNHETRIVGPEIYRDDEPDYLATANMANLPDLAAIMDKIAESKKEPRVCAYCSGKVTRLAGVDMDVMTSLLGCEKCGAAS